MLNAVGEVRVLFHLLTHFLQHVVGELILELFLLMLREVVLDLSFVSFDGGHEVGGLLGDDLVVVGQIGADILLAAAAVIILLAGGLGLGARLRLRGGLGLRHWVNFGCGRLGHGLRHGLRLGRSLDASSGGIP